MNITRTNCSQTTLLSDWMISMYSNCVTVQASNKFLAKTAERLFGILDSPNGVIVRNDNAVITAKGCKEWCIDYSYIPN